MDGNKKYIFNEDTLSYEESRQTVWQRLRKVIFVLVAGAVVFFGYLYLYTTVLGWKLPKTILLERRNKELTASYVMMNQRLDEIGASLSASQQRDNMVYRSIFGMDEIPAAVRDSGFGGKAYYGDLSRFRNGAMIASAAMRLDLLTMKAFIQSGSFDEIELMAKRAGEMATCVPGINPVNMNFPGTRITSPFGYRDHPIKQQQLFHSGIDISGRKGLPVVATGDGVVVLAASEYFGYGNCVIIDHGFGYKTKYAHLKKIDVEQGQKVSRGQLIGELGSSGQSTGAHLHYEVIYKNNNVNPWNYLIDEDQ